MGSYNPFEGGIMFAHWSDVPMKHWRWPNFTPKELACPRTGEYFHHEPSLDCLQNTRDIVDGPVKTNSAHRSVEHNMIVGGAPFSAHKCIAFDLSTRKIPRETLWEAVKRSGFRSFGYYSTFIHCDFRPGRRWYSSQSSKEIWTPILSKGN